MFRMCLIFLFTLIIFSCSNPILEDQKVNIAKDSLSKSIAFPTYSPYPIYEAENYSSQSGIRNYGTCIGNCDNGDWVAYSNINFDAIPTTNYHLLEIYEAVPWNNSNQVVEIRLDSTNGMIVGYLRPQATADWGIFAKMQTSLSIGSSRITGIHTLVFKFMFGSGVCDLESFRIIPSTVAPFDTINEVENYYTGLNNIRLINNFTTTGHADDGSIISFGRVDFGSKYNTVNRSLLLYLTNPGGYGRWIDVIIDGREAPQYADVTVPQTGGTFTLTNTSLGYLYGEHKLELRFKGGVGIVDVDWFKITYSK